VNSGFARATVHCSYFVETHGPCVSTDNSSFFILQWLRAKPLFTVHYLIVHCLTRKDNEISE